MKRITILLIAVFLLASFAQASSHTVSVEKTVTNSDIIYYEDTGIVSYPSVMSGNEVVERNNATFEEWAGWEAGDAATAKTREVIKNRLGTTDGLRTGSAGNGQMQVEVGYVTTEGEKPQFSYEELQSKTPEQVEATINFRNQNYTTTIPVQVQKVEAVAKADTYGLATGNSSTGKSKPVDMPDNKVPEIMVGGTALIILIAGVILYRRRNL